MIKKSKIAWGRIEPGMSRKRAWMARFFLSACGAARTESKASPWEKWREKD
ncbi:MAG: hypothetical protein ACE15F_04870 [bacterium]